MYSVFLEEWLRVFPLEQVHILRLEDYAVDKQQSLSDLYEFLELRKSFSNFAYFIKDEAKKE